MAVLQFRGLLDPVMDPAYALDKRTGSDPGGAAEAVPHKRLAMLIYDRITGRHQGSPNAGGSIAPVGAGARMGLRLTNRPRIRPRWRGAVPLA